MTTSPPQVNGHARPAALPVLGEWQAITSAVDVPVAEPHTEPAAPAIDLVAQAEADAIRTRVYAEAEERRIKAEAEAEAMKIKAAEEARKQKLANDKAEARAAEEQAARDARIAESKAKQEDAERAQAKARQAEREQQEAEAVAAEEVQNADASWKYFAIAFAVACAVVALPVQMSAFWHPDRPWMISAPFMLEAGAWVVLRGAAAAVAAHRPHWHFRLIAWALAFISAGINLWHGLAAFDTATAIGTAFASLAGPGVWDLHEHGRIRKRDGVQSRRERRAGERAAKKQAAARATQEQREVAREEARQKAVEAIEKRLAEQREAEFPDEWKCALKLAVAMGETSVTDTVWDRAWDDMHAAAPGVTANSISARNAAAVRMQRVLERDPTNTPSKTTNAQRANQINKPRRPSSYTPVPPVRKPGDTPPYHRAARRAHGETKRRLNAAKNVAAEEQK